LVVTGEDAADLRLLNLNFVNGETFFNFSCFENSDKTLEEAAQSATDETSESSEALAFFETDISPIIQDKCIACHQSGGVAGATNLVYVSSSTPGHLQTNYDTLSNYIVAGNGATLLNKGRGVSHGGDQQFSSDSEEFSDLSAFIDLLGEEGAADSTTGSYWEGVTLASPVKTLRRASFLLRGNPPTEAEELAVISGGEDALRGSVRGLMNGDGFHGFLTRGANDRLFTDKFLTNTAAFEVSDPNRRFFPLAAAYQYDANVAAGAFNAPQDLTWRDDWQAGLARSPVELIAYIVEEDRNYQEVVTADYMMVNYMSNQFLDAGASFDTEDPRVFKPGQNNGQIVNDDLLISEYTLDFGVNISSHGPFLEYPTAGVLNTHAFLNRYPTTETNRNRARARWTYYHFLGVDIEKSAERTIDAEALADNDNPTMNNPACTTCHAIHDPVAGTFQNYDSVGHYRTENFGIDSLPQSYKENSDDYAHGDTWFRDMRSPGFEGDVAPSQDNSIQWLGQAIANQDRYSEAAIKFWWPSLMGAPVLEAPTESGDKNFDTDLAAYEAQNSFIQELAEQFSSGIEGGAAYNGKDLLTSLVLSEWFRADQVESVDVKNRLVTSAGTRRLLTPEELEQKSLSLLGWRWGQYPHSPDEETNFAFIPINSHLQQGFKIYYGGTDSDGITERSSALTALMVNVAEKHALEMSCPAVMLDFEREDGSRLLFDGIDAVTTPATEIIRDFSVEAASEEEQQTYSLTTTVASGEKVLDISMTNSFFEEGVGQRDLTVVNFSAVNESGQTVYMLDFSDINTVTGATYTCGNIWDRGFEFYCNGTMSVPFPVELDGEYTFSVIAHGKQYGSDGAKMTVGLSSTDATSGNTQGAQAIKTVIANLHGRLLGQSLVTTAPEIEMAFDLLVASWQARKVVIDERNDNTAFLYPSELCYFPDHYDTEGGARVVDPSGMKHAWQSVLSYLMTDFNYLHE
ncbi:MAG: DUF1588 domain-containing protein, partial [Gammaproteobacteria bacterium]|nr:DUF1588 domain-containing protein [Gammaproteobacteria bacterium]